MFGGFRKKKYLCNFNPDFGGFNISEGMTRWKPR